MFNACITTYLDSLMPALRVVWPTAEWTYEQTESGRTYVHIAMPDRVRVSCLTYITVEAEDGGFKLYSSISNREWGSASLIDLLHQIPRMLNMMASKLPDRPSETHLLNAA